MIPYPWKQENTFDVRRRWSARAVSIIGIPAAILATILGGPIPAIVGAALAYRWSKTNANPRSYATIMLAAGLILAAISTLFYGGTATIFLGIVVPAAIIAFVWWSPTISQQNATAAYGIAATAFTLTALWAATGGFHGIDHAVFSLTAPAANGPLPVSAIPRLWAIWFPYGLILGSFTLYWWMTARDYSTQKYLQPRRETYIAKKRTERNTARYVDTQPDKQLVPALVVGDRLPWRQDRLGIPAIIPTEDEIGHGCVLGANGSGKTVAALTLSEQVINKNIPLIFADFKGDLSNRDKLAQMADETGAQFFSFDLRLHDDDKSNCFYDPLDFEGSRNDKAAIVSQAFQYETTEEAYYRGAADKWLPIQFAIMENVGLDEGQGTFDFLASTSSVERAKARIAPLRETDPGIYNDLLASIESMDDKRLEGLRTNIDRIVDSPAGARMHRPTARELEAGAVYLDVRELANDNGSVVYFGLGIGGQGGLAKMLGALVVYSIQSFIDWRNANPDVPRPDYFFIADEFGSLEEYTDMFKFLFTNARSARVWVWVMSQSLTNFTDAIIDNIITNTYWFLIFKLADTRTAELLEATTGKIHYRFEMTEGMVEETATGGRKMKRSGGVRTDLKKDWHIPADLFTKLKPNQAFFWCNASVEPTRRDQWWRRGRPTFTEPRIGEDEYAKDIPIVYFIPSELVRSKTEVIEHIDVGPAPLAAARPSSQQQQNTLHMLRRWVGDSAANDALDTEDARTFADLDRQAASRVINRLVDTHMRDLHAAAGDDRYFTEFNKIARFVHQTPLTGIGEIPDSYNKLPVSAVRMLHEQLDRTVATTTSDNTDAPGFADATPGDPAPNDDSGFQWGVIDPPPDPDNPPAPDEHEPRAHDDNPSPADDQPAPADPAPAPVPVAGFADDGDEAPFVLPATTTTVLNEQTPVAEPDLDGDDPDDAPSTEQDTPAANTEPAASTADDTPQPRTGDDPSSGPSAAERRMRAVYERAFDLINVDPEHYGLPELDPGYEYTWGDHRDGYPYGKRVKRAAWTAALADAQQQIPALD